MSPLAQKQALAKLDGFYQVENGGWCRAGLQDRPRPGWALPRYCKDLNVIHKLERSLQLHKKFSYVQELILVVGKNEEANTQLVCATAENRAEAILRYFNLWDDSK